MNRRMRAYYYAVLGAMGGLFGWQITDRMGFVSGQNVYLEVSALGLATVAVGAFDDQAVWEALGLPEGCEPLYLMPLGKPA